MECNKMILIRILSAAIVILFLLGTHASSNAANQEEKIKALESQIRTLLQQNRRAEADKLNSELKNTYDKTTINKIQSLESSFNALLQNNRYEEAQKVAEEMVMISEKSFGSTHITAQALNNLGIAYSMRGAYNKSISYFEQAIGIEEHSPLPDYEYLIKFYGNIAESLVRLKKLNEAEDFLAKAKSVGEEALEPTNPQYQYSLEHLASFYDEQGKPGKAEQVLKQHLKINKEHFGQDAAETLRVQQQLASIYRRQGQHSKANPLLKSLTENNWKDFQKLLQESSMTFTLPEGFSIVPTIENHDVGYNFAIKSPTLRLEIRYKLYPLKADMQEYSEFLKRKAKDPNSIEAIRDPNKMFEEVMTTIFLNISHTGRSKQLEYGSNLPDHLVKSEFSADRGMAAKAPLPDTAFANGYKKCYVIGLHVDNKADAFIIYMFDDFNSVKETINKTLHALRFK
jgi:tetratricopeptide (TPR) repeat protein